MTETSPPKPTVALIICSVLVLAACGFLISFAIACFVDAWDPCAIIGGIIILPVPLALAIQQYRGTFRRNAKAASTSGVLLLLSVGLSLLVFVAATGEIGSVNLALSAFASGAVGSFAGWMNLRWSRQLKAAGPLARGSLGPMQFSLRELLALMTAVAYVAGLSTYFVRTTLPQYAEHVSRDEAPFGLPEGATDVSFCRRSRGQKAYEFTIDEPGFVAWVDSHMDNHDSDGNRVLLEPITMSRKMSRYSQLSFELTGPDSITITDGLYYHWSKEDQWEEAAFDRTTNRAYYKFY